MTKPNGKISRITIDVPFLPKYMYLVPHSPSFKIAKRKTNLFLLQYLQTSKTLKTGNQATPLSCILLNHMSLWWPENGDRPTWRARTRTLRSTRYQASGQHTDYRKILQPYLSVDRRSLDDHCSNSEVPSNPVPNSELYACLHTNRHEKAVSPMGPNIQKRTMQHSARSIKATNKGQRTRHRGSRL